MNLGFAGGVNVGLTEARGEIMVLLNQDCIVQPGWLEPLLALFKESASCGIAGAIIYDPDGNINHTGAQIERPLALGVHQVEIPSPRPYLTEYVTGALFAIRRSVWQQVGPLDDAYYPAYFEECDYCARARRLGFQVFVAPDARAEHLFTSRAWQHDPLRHTSDQHRSRYRFICKQFDSTEFTEFFEAEVQAIAVEHSFHEAAGRKLAAAYTLDHLQTILLARVRDGASALLAPSERQLSVGFAAIHRGGNSTGATTCTAHPG